MVDHPEEGDYESETDELLHGFPFPISTRRRPIFTILIRTINDFLRIDPPGAVYHDLNVNLRLSRRTRDALPVELYPPAVMMKWDLNPHDLP